MQLVVILRHYLFFIFKMSGDVWDGLDKMRTFTEYGGQHCNQIVNAI
jgi:hypothetical protein